MMFTLEVPLQLRNSTRSHFNVLLRKRKKRNVCANDQQVLCRKFLQRELARAFPQWKPIQCSPNYRQGLDLGASARRPNFNIFHFFLSPNNLSPQLTQCQQMFGHRSFHRPSFVRRSLRPAHPQLFMIISIIHGPNANHSMFSCLGNGRQTLNWPWSDSQLTRFPRVIFKFEEDLSGIASDPS